MGRKLKKVKQICFFILVGFGISACARTDEVVAMREPIEEVLNDGAEIVGLYEAHRLFLESKAFIKVIGLDPSRVRAIEVYSMRDEEDFMLYTLNVTTEVPLVGNDVKCIQQKYEVVMDKQEACKVKSITPTSLFVAHVIEQVPYQSVVSEHEQNQIKRILNTLLSKDESFFRNYERSWLEGYNAWIQFLSGAPAFYKEIKTNEDHYKACYSLNVSPYSLEDEHIDWDMDKISFKVEPLTTKKIHFVRVNIPAEVLRDYHNKLYYNYEYLVVLNEADVIGIKFVRKEPL